MNFLKFNDQRIIWDVYFRCRCLGKGKNLYKEPALSLIILFLLSHASMSGNHPHTITLSSNGKWMFCNTSRCELIALHQLVTSISSSSMLGPRQQHNDAPGSRSQAMINICYSGCSGGILHVWQLCWSGSLH